MRLRDKAIVVTGGGTGIGRAIVERCLEEGARVTVHALDAAPLREARERWGGRAVVVEADLVDPASPARIVAAAREAFGRIDGVVNNAARTARSSLSDTTPEFFTEMMALNLRAPLFLLQAAWPSLRETRGAVLNIGSVNAYCGEATLLDYSLTKGALMTLSRNLANAGAPEGVRVNHLNVGWVLSEREYAHQIELGQPADWPDRVPPTYAPSGRLIRPEEIAAAAVYWLGDESRPVSGAVVELEQYPIIGRNPVKS
jgi:NAD(P)-dependent dehydrogenase (short-subunit alcohol dehydrogenase family)